MQEIRAFAELFRSLRGRINDSLIPGFNNFIRIDLGRSVGTVVARTGLFARLTALILVTPYTLGSAGRVASSSARRRFPLFVSKSWREIAVDFSVRAEPEDRVQLRQSKCGLDLC